jgi:16S rRNA G966 N2-methylase RsmD
VKPDLQIDPVIRSWIAPLDAKELELLEASIATEGCRDALIAWNGVLIDGHHRHEICRREKKPYRVTEMSFPNRDHAEVWVRQNQAGRRNLTNDQRAMNASFLEEALGRVEKSARGKAGRATGGKRKPDEDRLEVTANTKRSSGTEKKDRSRAKAAKAHRVTQNLVRRATAVRKKAPALAKKVAAGEIAIKAAEKAIRETDRQTKRADAAAVAKAATVGDDRQVVHGSFVEVADSIAADSVAFVFTDPPYHDKTIGTYADLGRVAARVLKPNGSLITYTSHHRIPEVIRMLQDAGLTFFWPIAMVHTGTKARMTEYGIVVHWKPLLWFVKGAFRSRDDLRFVNDLVVSTPQKDAHPWQQSTVEAKYYIEQLTSPGDLVFDPFCGGGTTAVAAAQTLRRWITCDTDDQAVHIARQRVAAAMETPR